MSAMYKNIINDYYHDNYTLIGHFFINLLSDENKISMMKEVVLFSLFHTLKWRNNSTQIHQYKHETLTADLCAVKKHHSNELSETMETKT